MPQEVADHAALMDATYRHQRRIYDLTRRWYLLGRDRLIAELDPPPGARVLEIACGTGRNLDRISRRYPGRDLHGLDISREMLRSAEARLGGRARLAFGDACSFSGRDLFGVPLFDRIILSFAVSMIPDWQQAVRNALAQLAPGGELHIVDFHDQSGLPSWFRRALWSWLGRFHVVPRTALPEFLAALPGGTRLGIRHRALFRGYSQYATAVRLLSAE